MEDEDPLDIGDIEVVDDMYARAGLLALDALMRNQRAAQLLIILPEGGLKPSSCMSKLKTTGLTKTSFTRSVLRGKRDRASLGSLRSLAYTGIVGVYYHNAYPVTASYMVCSQLSHPDPANLATLRDDDLKSCDPAGRGALSGRPERPRTNTQRRQKIQEGEERVHKTGATLDDVAELENISKNACVVREHL